VTANDSSVIQTTKNSSLCLVAVCSNMDCLFCICLLAYSDGSIVMGESMGLGLNNLLFRRLVSVED